MLSKSDGAGAAGQPAAGLEKCPGCPEKATAKPCTIADCPSQPAQAAPPLVRRHFTIVWKNGRTTKQVVEGADFAQELMTLIMSTPEFGQGRPLWAKSDLGNLYCVTDMSAVLPN